MRHQYHFWVFGMTRPRIEPHFPEPFVLVDWDCRIHWLLLCSGVRLSRRSTKSPCIFRLLMINWIVWKKLLICIKMFSALNKPQSLICHEALKTNHQDPEVVYDIWSKLIIRYHLFPITETMWQKENCSSSANKSEILFINLHMSVFLITLFSFLKCCYTEVKLATLIYSYYTELLGMEPLLSLDCFTLPLICIL